MEMFIPRSGDITKMHLVALLENKTTGDALGNVDKALKEIHIDRILQSFIDEVLANEGFDPSKAMLILGMTKMGQIMKQFICNIANVSITENRIEDSIDEIEDLRARGFSEEELKHFKR